MLKLARRYADKPADQWPALFHTILQTTLRDHYRRQAVRNRWRAFWNKDTGSDDGADVIAEAPDLNQPLPEQHIDNQRSLSQVEQALANLPLRQQQAFILRTWEGLSTEETAKAMKLSTGSVKTHLSRARASLQHQLQDFAP